MARCTSCASCATLHVKPSLPSRDAPAALFLPARPRASSALPSRVYKYSKRTEIGIFLVFGDGFPDYWGVRGGGDRTEGCVTRPSAGGWSCWRGRLLGGLAGEGIRALHVPGGVADKRPGAVLAARVVGIAAPLRRQHVGFEAQCFAYGAEGLVRPESGRDGGSRPPRGFGRGSPSRNRHRRPRT